MLVGIFSDFLTDEVFDKKHLEIIASTSCYQSVVEGPVGSPQDFFRELSGSTLF